MSMSYGCAYGYGLCTEQLDKISEQEIIVFLKKHLSQNNQSKKRLEYIPDFLSAWEERQTIPFEETSILDIVNFFNEYENCYGRSGKFAMFDLISALMSEEVNIGLYFYEFEGEMGLMFPETMPWNFNDKERSLTGVDELQEIFQPYLFELGIPEEKIDAVQVVWWG